MRQHAGTQTALTAVDLYWLPVGAGGRTVDRCSRAYELTAARIARRPPQALLHAALEVSYDAARYVIEVAPVWSDPSPDRGVVVEGPVGNAVLGHFRAFRYEVRRWREGRIPDRVWAVEPPSRLSTTPESASRVLGLVPATPPLTWGRNEEGLGEMWTSNSVVSWLLATADLLLGVDPPQGGRAPGWQAGIELAGRCGRR
jgi:hypothetical protein